MNLIISLSLFIVMSAGWNGSALIAREEGFHGGMHGGQHGGYDEHHGYEHGGQHGRYDAQRGYEHGAAHGFEAGASMNANQQPQVIVPQQDPAEQLFQQDQ